LIIIQDFIWGEAQEHAFEELKAKFLLAPILRQPTQG
jgi:hypothetical protein